MRLRHWEILILIMNKRKVRSNQKAVTPPLQWSKKKSTSPRYIHLSIDSHLTQVDRWSIRSYCLFCALHHLHAIRLLDQSTWSSSLTCFLSLTDASTYLNWLETLFSSAFVVRREWTSFCLRCCSFCVILTETRKRTGKTEMWWCYLWLLFGWIFVSVFLFLYLFRSGKIKLEKMFSTLHHRRRSQGKGSGSIAVQIAQRRCPCLDCSRRLHIWWCEERRFFLSLR